jgi:3-phenylpropionate/trans-cinnamate dioxygenase ferredoxin component
MSFREVTSVDQIPAGKMKAFMVDGKNILIVNHEGKFYAISDICTHMGGELSKGKLEGIIVTCPRHGSSFDITTGKCLSGPKIGPFKLTTKDEPVYEVKIEGSTIKVNI